MNEFELWAYRGLVSVLSVVSATLIIRRWNNQDGKEEALSREIQMQRKELFELMTKTENRVAESMDKLSQAVVALEKLIAREYPTRQELKAQKEDFQRELDKCAEGCPFRNSL